ATDRTAPTRAAVRQRGALAAVRRAGRRSRSRAAADPPLPGGDAVGGRRPRPLRAAGGLLHRPVRRPWPRRPRHLQAPHLAATDRGGRDRADATADRGAPPPGAARPGALAGTVRRARHRPATREPAAGEIG